MLIRNVIIFFIIFISGSIKAQPRASADELFKTAREAAFEDYNYDKAKQIAYQALQISPDYADIEIFLGRVFAWNKQYDSARYHFSKVLDKDSANEDASIAYTDLEYWNNDYAIALQICDRSLLLNSSSEELLLRKAKILNATKNYKEAEIIITQLLKINQHNSAALALANSIKNATANCSCNLFASSAIFVALIKSS